MKSRILISSDEFTKEFVRCAKTYTHLKIAVAWCGNPEQTLPYKFLEDFNGKIEVILGTSFYYTHPNSFLWFRKIKADLKIFRKEVALFHPKVYLFLKGKKYALFIGSSNLTGSGFYTNIETNTLMEGIKGSKNTEVRKLEKQFKEWQGKIYSFNLSKQWLTEYRKKYNQNARREKKYGIVSPRRNEEEIGTASWLKKADWDTYNSKLKEGMKKEDREQYWNVLDAAKKNLRKPWKPDYIKDIAKRRIIEGLGEYGFFGHIAASGKLRQFLSSGSNKKLNVIVDAINNIIKLNHPVSFNKLEIELNKLESLGFTMKVWGRLLCLVRPDLFCTVASPTVRVNLAKALKVTQNKFVAAEGYIKLIQLIHSSPWFNSKRPNDKIERNYWKNRVALMDLIFY